jgi:hypothetical protein
MKKQPKSGAARIENPPYLVDMTESASRSSQNVEKLRIDDGFRRSEIIEKTGPFFLQSVARELMPNSRIRVCRRVVIPNRNSVELWHSKKRGKAYYQNLMVCDMAWACPPCAIKITENRRKVLDRLCNVGYPLVVLDDGGEPRTVAARRWFLAMMTFSIQHKSREAFAVVLSRLSDSYHRMWSGRWAVAYKHAYRIVGFFRSLEPTYGVNGWHPHIHLLLVMDSAINDYQVAIMQSVARDRWVDSVAACGGQADWQHGLNLVSGDNRVTQYLDKMGQAVSETLGRWTTIAEFTKSVVKRGRKVAGDAEPARTLWDLLLAYSQGDVEAGRLWLEAQAALRGKSQLIASPGLWERLGAPGGIDSPLLADDTIDPGDFLLASLNLDDWRLISRHDARGALLAVAKDGDRTRINSFIQRLRSLE